MHDARTRFDGSMRERTVGYTQAACSLGVLWVAGTRRGVCLAVFADGADPDAAPARGDTRLASWARRLVDGVEGRTAVLDVPLDVRGTPFQRAVWEELRRIPRGETRHYGEVARELGREGAARAVARACAANPVAVAIPCHRVVPASGGVGGYAWGEARKRALLERESGRPGRSKSRRRQRDRHGGGKSSGRASAALRP